jgi:hypothetical protein
MNRLATVLTLSLLAAGAPALPAVGGPTLAAVGGPALAAQGPAPAPLRRIHAYVCGLHFYSGQMERQVVAHHYCSHLGPDLMQCVIYDSGRPDARLIGIEYVLSAARFRTLPEDEKKLWHSHAYEVKSGLLVAPGLKEQAEDAMLRDFAGTYGKTWHTWQVDRDHDLPLGIPQLMMGFTADGQVDPQVLAGRDLELGIRTDRKRRRRAGFPELHPDPGADAWKLGNPWQLTLEQPGTPLRIPMH